MTSAQAIATALRAPIVGILCFVASYAPAANAGESNSPAQHVASLDESTAQENQSPVATAASSAAPDKHLARLDEAARLWEASKPKSYSYTLSMGYAFTGHSYKISVTDGVCTAKSKDYRLRRSQWESVACEGLTITEVFANLRKEWLACPGAYVTIGFDDRYGYITDLFFDPNTELSDQFWSLTLSRFKARR